MGLKVSTLFLEIGVKEIILTFCRLAANKEELLDMIQHGAESIVNSKDRLVLSLNFACLWYSSLFSAL